MNRIKAILIAPLLTVWALYSMPLAVLMLLVGVVEEAVRWRETVTDLYNALWVLLWHNRRMNRKDLWRTEDAARLRQRIDDLQYALDEKTALLNDEIKSQHWSEMRERKLIERMGPEWRGLP